PGVVLQDRHGMTILELVVFRCEEPAEMGLDSEHIEEVPGNQTNTDHLAALGANQAGQCDQLPGEAAEHRVPVAQRQVHGMGKRVQAVAALGTGASALSPELDELTWVADGKKPQQDLVGQSEHGGVGADAESQRQNGYAGKNR